MPSVKEIKLALMDVKDPELGYNIVDIGLIYDVKIENENVTVTYTLTSPACPAGALIENNIKEKVLQIEGVKNVATELTFSPAWTLENMSPEIKAEFGLFGI